MATLTLELPQARESMADTLPSVNFGFEDLRDRMSKFTVRFDAFIEKERKKVLDERNKFRKHVSEIKADQHQRKQEIEIAQLKSQTHAQTISKENAETAEMHAQISSLTQHRDELAEKRDELQNELSGLQSTLSARREVQAKQARYLHSQSRWNGPELQFWEDHLCMRIEGAGQADRLKFVFTHVCEKEWEREAWFELDTSEREYRVLKTGPKVEMDEVDACLDRLNESRELGPFFKGMREIFVKVFK
ncbi:kinetochore protein-like protein spc25 [Microthyrium microscopicum]|uniref:Kinetochore protein SPC25 n=1 Tax=Microthyrium microscopicum TaxID=703497 RepID=A0A6A6UNJ9_9PEZI|nr:kinetochore protein-like protein spc25 [Microthyrium microscopicum]